MPVLSDNPFFKDLFNKAVSPSEGTFDVRGFRGAVPPGSDVERLQQMTSERPSIESSDQMGGFREADQRFGEMLNLLRRVRQGLPIQQLEEKLRNIP